MTNLMPSPPGKVPGGSATEMPKAPQADIDTCTDLGYSAKGVVCIALLEPNRNM